MITWNKITPVPTETGTFTGHGCCMKDCRKPSRWYRQHEHEKHFVSFYFCEKHARENGLPEENQ